MSDIEDQIVSRASQGAVQEGEAPLSWGQFCSGCASSMKERSGKDWGMSIAKSAALIATLYFFLFSLDLMGGSFKVLGGCSAGGLFDGVTNPIAGLMIGILATVLVQSSSTSTSIVVSLVGAGSMSVPNAVPVIMGANIGTSVTNTIVSMGQVADPDQFERAFSGATVHDMFNFLSVAVLLPIEAATHMLVHLTSAMMPSTMGDKGEKWVGPIKKWVGPAVKLVLGVDKKVISNVALGKDTCESVYAKVVSGDRSAGLIKCATDELTGVKTCPIFYKAGATQADDMAAGGVALFISLVFLCVCLGLMVKLLQSMVLNTSASMLRKSTDLNGYLAMIVGALITILVQSSSVTTSVLTPLVGVGILPLEKMLPLTLGANIGTTATALLASLVSTKPEAVQIALCHLFFNVIGILIWYPIPFMRAFPLNAAKSLGKVTRRYRAFPLVYIFFAFVVAPLLLFGLSSLFELGSAYTVLATIITVFLIISIGYFLFWWNKKDGAQIFYTMLEHRQVRADTAKNLPVIIGELRREIEMLKKNGGKKDVEMVSHPADPHDVGVSLHVA